MKKTVLLLVLGLAATVAVAQNNQFHFGLSIPQGKFGDGEGDEDYVWSSGKGLAVLGVNVGYKHLFPIESVQNFSLALNVDLFWNPVTGDEEDFYEEKAGWDDFSAHSYVNIPAMFGVNYAIPVNPNLKFYGEVGVGANISILTDRSYEGHSTYDDMVYKFDPAVGFAYGLEAGLIFNQKYAFSLRYSSLGSYKYDYEVDYASSHNSDDDKKFSKKLPISMLGLCFGIYF